MFDMDLIETMVSQAIAIHPKDCEFMPNAIEHIVLAALKSKYMNSQGMVNFLAAQIRSCEVYCPHEGIDRRVR